jgi:transposase-like protein
MVVSDYRRKRTLAPIIRKNVAASSALYAGVPRSYRTMGAEYQRAFVDHVVKYVEGRFHADTLEKFSSCPQASDSRHLHCAGGRSIREAYVDEQVCFNNRQSPNGARIEIAMEGVEGLGLSYKTLTKSHKIWCLKPGRAAKSPLSQSRKKV